MTCVRRESSAPGVEDSRITIQRAMRLIERARERIASSERVLSEADGRLLEMDARNADPAPTNLPKPR